MQAMPLSMVGMAPYCCRRKQRHLPATPVLGEGMGSRYHRPGRLSLPKQPSLPSPAHALPPAPTCLLPVPSFPLGLGQGQPACGWDLGQLGLVQAPAYGQDSGWCSGAGSGWGGLGLGGQWLWWGCTGREGGGDLGRMGEAQG